MSDHVDYDTVERELQRQITGLYGADAATVQAESDRLRSLAERIEDDLWRQRAIRRAEQLPSLVAGPVAGTSEQYREAEQLLGQGMTSREGVSAADRIIELERITQRIAELSTRAPYTEAGAILRMNSALARLIEDLRLSLPDH
jgi:hypothetical protein